MSTNKITQTSNKDATTLNENVKDATIETKTEMASDSILVTKKKAPDGGWGWCIVIGMLILRIVCGSDILMLILVCLNQLHCKQTCDNAKFTKTHIKIVH